MNKQKYEFTFAHWEGENRIGEKSIIAYSENFAKRCLEVVYPKANFILIKQEKVPND